MKKENLEQWGFSIVGSLIVIILDAQFIVDEIKIFTNPWLTWLIAFLMIGYIEGLYLYLPTLFLRENRQGPQRFFDWTLYVFVFLLSVTGASLQASKHFASMYSQNYTQRDSIQESRENESWYKEQIKENSATINKLLETPEEKRTLNEQATLSRLSRENERYSKELVSTRKGDQKKEEPINQSPTWLSQTLDLARVFFTFAIVMIIQWGNGRISFVRARGESPKINVPVMSEHEIEELLNSIDPKELDMDSPSNPDATGPMTPTTPGPETTRSEYTIAPPGEWKMDQQPIIETPSTEPTGNYFDPTPEEIKSSEEFIEDIENGKIAPTPPPGNYFDEKKKKALYSQQSKIEDTNPGNSPPGSQ